jgi:alpha-glucosidase
LRADESSILHLYRRVLAARRGSPALCRGAWAALEPAGAPVSVLAFERREGGDRRAVLVNFSATPASVVLDGRWAVEVDTEGAVEGQPFDGALHGDHGLVLRPA